MLLGYARVSKAEAQEAAGQVAALRASGCDRIYQEAASGSRWDRPELHRLLDQLRPGDVVVVWKLDRLSRSLKDLLLILERIEQAEAGFRSLTEAVETTGPAGRMMMQMLGAFVEFERAMIRGRTRAGLATTRKEGRVGGRRPNHGSVSAASFGFCGTTLMLALSMITTVSIPSGRVLFVLPLLPDQMPTIPPIPRQRPGDIA